jgi:DNA-binding HxlR family transcriptional regulator
VTNQEETRVCICPLGSIIDLISKKWALLVINTIGNYEKLRYNEIMKHLDGINPKSLSDRLKELEGAGLIKKELFAEIPPRSEYSLTKDGKELRKAIIPLMNWVNTRHHKLEGGATPCYVAYEKERIK